MAPLPQRAPQTHHRSSTCDEIAPRPQDHAYPPVPRRRRPKGHGQPLWGGPREGQGGVLRLRGIRGAGVGRAVLRGGGGA
eukprot:2783105-Prymnesium_polylepis.1